MSATELVNELEALPRPERVNIAKRVLESLCPDRSKEIDRLMQRIANPDIPEDFWEAVQEVEDGKAIDMKDEHFDHPPV